MNTQNKQKPQKASHYKLTAAAKLKNKVKTLKNVEVSMSSASSSGDSSGDSSSESNTDSASGSESSSSSREESHQTTIKSKQHNRKLASI